MKSIFKYSIIAAVGGFSLFTSCEDTLDADKYLDDRVTLETIFTDINQTNGWLTQAFSYLKGALAEVKTKGGAFSECFADDIYYGDRDSNNLDGFNSQDSYNALKQGDYNENYGSEYWRNAYRGIYQASVFIHNVDQNYRLTEEERTDLKGQARFVRAYFYWLLLRRYGPVPIMPDEGVDYTQSYDDLATARSNYDECACFIASEMEQACNELRTWNRFTDDTDATSIIRPTKGAALAVRALAYTFAASPLANGQLQNGYHPDGVSDAFAKNLKNKDGKQLLPLEYDESKWARAAAACRDVMECPANYELYHRVRQTVDRESEGYPVTVTPPNDGDFSTKNWPEGWADIDPYLSYRDFFNGTVSLSNSEIIFSRGYSAADIWHDNVDGFVGHQLPSSLHGYNCHGMTQKMVDAYYMNDGTDVPGKDSEMNGGDGSERPTEWTTEDEGEYCYKNFAHVGPGVSMQYVNREPRFYASVGFNGAYWWNANPTDNLHYMQIYYWRGTTMVNGVAQNNGYTNTSFYLRTGIGIKKYVNPADYKTEIGYSDSNYGHFVHKWEPAMRYADILLLYAEALNELTTSYQVASWDGSTTYTISRDINEMKRGIRPIRCRAGVPDFSMSEYSDQTTLRNKIKRERMIEFMGEGKRLYDLRRWMDAPVEESKIIYGCNVMMTDRQKDEFQKVVPCYSLPTIFTEKMYFWPITFSELKRNKLLVQNPGWQSQE